MSARDLTGSRLGGYVIGARLGAGGMGEVYRAREPRLGREVALKILPEEVATDPERVRRFDREARAASALSHPNIVAVYDVGSAGALSYIAMELVEGKSLREVLRAGPLPLKTLLGLAGDVASALARAHQAGIVHRDLKPENVMVSRDGLAKVLDFGLAKRLPTDGGASPDEATMTGEGLVLGTAGYMSPEQASGHAVDFRSDQFAFGSMLYEMASGRRAFERPTKAETLAAVIREEPAPLGASLPAPLRWTIGRCLAKDPSGRYASTEDLTHELRTLRERLPELGAAAVPLPRLAWWPTALLAAAALAALAVAALALRRGGERPLPDFQRLTFERGAAWTARFAPDGRTVVYGGAWNGEPLRLYTTRTDGHESTRLGLPDGDVAGVSAQGELAMLLGRPLGAPLPAWVGTLARVPLGGGAPKEVLEQIAAADWSADGKQLAVARAAGRKQRVEFPPGHVLYETNGFVETLRLSPDGKRLALLVRDGDISVETVDLSGRHVELTRGWKRGSGLAWSPDGREVWFAANEGGWRSPLHAVGLDGKVRMLLRLPSLIHLHDVARDGRVLLTLGVPRVTMWARGPADEREHELSWHEGSQAKGLTPDGKTLLFDEANEGVFHAIYVRSMEGGPAKRLGEGRGLAISPDGQWVAANTGGRGSPSVLLPTGAGAPRTLDVEGHRIEEAAFFPDGQRLLISTLDAGHAARSYVKDLRSGQLRAIGPEGVACAAVSPDGLLAACLGPGGAGLIYPLAGGDARPIPGHEKGRDRWLQWSTDPRFLFVMSGGLPGSHPLRVARVDLATGAREPWRDIPPADRDALMFANYFFAMTPDGRTYGYTCVNMPSDLYLVSGLR